MAEIESTGSHDFGRQPQHLVSRQLPAIGVAVSSEKGQEARGCWRNGPGAKIRRWLNTRIGGRDWLRRFLRGSFWHSLGTIAAKVLGIITSFVLARVLGVDGFGRISFVQNSITTASSIASFGLGIVTTKHVAEFRQQPARLGGAVTLALLFATLGGAVVGTALVTNSESIAGLILTPAEAPYIRITGYGVFFAVVVLIAANVLIGLEAFKINAAVQLATGVITSVVTIVAGWYYGADAAINGFVISLLAAFVINLAVVARTLRQSRIRLSLRGARQEAEILFRYSLPSFLSGLAVVISGWLSRAIIINASGFAAFGIYAAANQFFMVITTLNSMFGAVLLPVFISQRTAKRSSRDDQDLEFFNLMFAWAFSVVALGLILFFSELIGAMLGRDYRQPVWNQVLSLVLLCACIVAHRQGMIRIILDRGLMWLALFGNIIWAVSVLVFTHWFRTEGALGLAVAMSLAYVINTLLVCPLYYALDLIPRYFLFSVYSGLVWLGVFGMIAMPWLTANFWLAKLGVVLFFLVSLRGLRSLWLNRKELCDSSRVP